VPAAVVVGAMMLLETLLESETRAVGRAPVSSMADIVEILLESDATRVYFKKKHELDMLHPFFENC
jgi:hypothetical protein